MSILKHGKTEDGKFYFFDFEISAEDFVAAVGEAYKKECHKINVPGFRKGHVPQKIVEKMYGESFFFDDALDALLPGIYDQCLKTANINVIDRPSVEVESIDKVNGVKGKFTVELRPELTVKQYKGIKAEKPAVEVTEEQVNNKVEELRNKQSRLVAVEDRASVLGDTAKFDFEGFVDGVAFDGGKAEDYSLVLGSHQFIEGFEDQMVGHNVGEEFDVNVRFPDDYGAKELAGKDAVFKIKLHELRTREMPEVDDEFAKDVSEFETLDELKNDLKAKLTEEAESVAKETFENAVMEKIVEGLEGEVPQKMIDQRIDEDIYNFETRLSSNGLDIKNYLKYLGQSEEDFRKGFAAQAEKQVKTRLALEAVVRAENITVTDEDVEKEFADIAEKYKMDVDKVKELINSEDLRADIAANRALDFVTKHAEA